jgi:transcription elongation GreA/GreB family factor
MPASQLLELAQTGDYQAFESRCLELLEGGELSLRELRKPFQELERSGNGERLITLTQMILDNDDIAAEADAALAIAQTALVAAPKSDELRTAVADLYRKLHGDRPGFDKVLEQSGLAGGRPPRGALKMLEFCLLLEPGAALISRMDDRVVEVLEIDLQNVLFTLRREGRPTTLPAPEVVREYDRVAADDFRVLRELRPGELAALIQEDPVRVIIGQIHAHGGMMDADLLKHELVPKYIESKQWSKWWTAARSRLKKSPHVIIEGRSPMILSYSAEARTLEDETWETLEGQREPVAWMSQIETYLREKKSRKEKPEDAFLVRIEDHVRKYALAVQPHRPWETLTCGLVMRRLTEKGLESDAATLAIAPDVLRDAEDPGTMLRAVPHEGLRELGVALLQEVRPDDWAKYALGWLATAPAGLLDKLVTAALAAGYRDEVQQFIDAGLSDPARHPELVYWLWKGPKQVDQLRLPPDDELFRLIVDTLSTLGRTVTADADVVKAFRHRMKAALALRGYARVKECLERTSEAAGITLRREFARLEGLGENTPAKLLDLLRDVHPKLWVVKPRAVPPWADPDTIWTTRAGFDKRIAERDELVNVKMPENAKRIGEAASHGDLSENSEYKFALEERDLLRGRLATINDELSRAQVIEPAAIPTESVGVGSRVRLRFLDDRSERMMTFFGPFDTNVDAGIYSYQAPVSQVLMGKQPGERVKLTVDGKEREVEVVEVAAGLTKS